MYGMSRIGDDVFIFITYHKEEAEEGKNYADGKPDYADAFEDNLIFKWDSQIGKDNSSPYMQKVLTAPRKHLLVKKSDAETSFYYMGQFDIIESADSQKEDNNGKMKPIAKGDHENASSCARGFVKIFTEQYFKGERGSMKTIRSSRSRDLRFHRAQNKNIFHRKGLRRIQRWLGIPRREDRSRRNSTAGGCQRDPGGTGCHGQSRRPDRYHRVRLSGISFIHGLFLV